MSNWIPAAGGKSIAEDPAIVTASIHYLRQHLQTTGLSVYFDLTFSDAQIDSLRAGPFQDPARISLPR